MSRWERWTTKHKQGMSLGSFIAEQLGPAEMARSMGLQSDGSGGYIDPSTGQVVARTVNNELVFYDPMGGAISAQSDGAELTQAQPSWRDPVTGEITVPPGQAESPEEIAAIPDPVPALAPASYNAFMNAKKKEMYAMQAPPEQEAIDDIQQEVDPQLGMQPQMGMGEELLTFSQMMEARRKAAPIKTTIDPNLIDPKIAAQSQAREADAARRRTLSLDRAAGNVRDDFQDRPTSPTRPLDTAPKLEVQQAKKSGEIASDPVRPTVSNQPTADQQREQYDWMNETRNATMKSLQERYAGTAREKQSIDKAITSRYEPLQKLLGEIKDPEVRDRQAKAFVDALSTRHRNNNGTNAMTSKQYEGLVKNREKLQGLDFDEDGNYDFDRIRNYKKDMIMHDDISDDYVNATYGLLPDHVRGALTHTSRKGLSDEQLDALQEKYPLAKRMKGYMDYSPVFWKQYLQTGGRDAYTGEHLDINDLNIEHILPGVSGLGAGKGSELYEWTEDPDNKVLTHRAPNQLKGDRRLKDFLDRQLKDYDPAQNDLYDFRADADEGAQGAKMKTRSFDIDNLANLLLDFGEDGKQEGVFKENLTPELYDQIIDEHKKQYQQLKDPILKAFHDKFDPDDLGYHQLTPKKLEAKLKEEGKEDQLGRYMMMREVFNQVNGLSPNIGQINKNMKIGKKTLPSNPRTDPAHGGVSTGSSKTRDAMNDAFTKSFLGKDRATQENLKRFWNESVEAGSNASRSIMDDEASEPDFYRRKERTQFAGLQAFHKKLQESGFLDDGVLDREEFAALKRDMAYHRDTDIEDHMSLFDSQKGKDGKAKANWFNKHLQSLMNEGFEMFEEEEEQEPSMEGLLQALSMLMDTEGGISSESPNLNFDQFRAKMKE